MTRTIPGGSVAYSVRTERRWSTRTPRNLLLLSAALALFVLLRADSTGALVAEEGAFASKRRSESTSVRWWMRPKLAASSAFGLREFQVLCSDRAIVPVDPGSAKAGHYFCLNTSAPCMNEETLVSVIGHEVAHISRRDFAINLICELVSLPISFHPLTYLIKREIERAREVACDELVTEQLLAPHAYARSLVRVANATAPHAEALVLSILMETFWRKES